MSENSRVGSASALDRAELACFSVVFEAEGKRTPPPYMLRHWARAPGFVRGVFRGGRGLVWFLIGFSASDTVPQFSRCPQAQQIWLR